MKFYWLIVVYATIFAVGNAQNAQNLSVDDMFAILEQNNTALKVSASNIEAANAGIAHAKSQRLPDVNTSLSVSYNGNILLMDREFDNVHGYSSPHFGNSFSLKAQQTVYSGGALTAGIRMAELEKEQSLLLHNLTRQQQRFLVLGLYLDIFKLQNRAKVYDKNIALTETLIADIRAKETQGMALENDVTRYELQLETLRLGLRKVNDRRAVLNHELCVALGLDEIEINPDTTIINNTLLADANTVEGEKSWQESASQSSPQLQMSQVATKIAEQNLRLAKSEMLPKVSIVAADMFDGPITYEVPALNKNINVWYVGVGVAYPISGLFKSNKKVEKAKVELRASKERTQNNAENLNIAVQSVYTDHQQSYAELSTEQKSVALAEQNYEVVNARYLNQLSLITDMLDASNILLDAQLKEVDARINVLYTFYRLKYVSGTI